MAPKPNQFFSKCSADIDFELTTVKFFGPFYFLFVIVSCGGKAVIASDSSKNTCQVMCSFFSSMFSVKIYIRQLSVSMFFNLYID